jgi:nucleoside-triphosphatase
MPPRVLLEARPGAGKTTAAARLIELLRADGLPVTGFVTRELRGGGGRRVGFELETVDGRRGLLAHVDIRGGPRVGRYGVALADLERLAVPLLERACDAIVVVDELGKMELASARFREVVTGLLARPLPLVATVHAFAHPFTDALKHDPSITVLPLTRANRDALPADLAARLR